MKLVYGIIAIFCTVISVKAISIGIPGSTRGSLSLKKADLLQSSNLFIRGGKKKSDRAKRSKTADNDVVNLPVEEPDAQIESEAVENEEESTSSVAISNLISKFYPKTLMKTPPITQAYVGASVVVTVLSFLFNNNKWPELLSFSWKAIFLKLQVWRFFSAFLSFGPMDMFYPFNLMYIWQHMSQLEKLSCKKPEEFFMLLMFGSVSLVGVYTLLGMPMKFLGHYLASYLVYIWSRAYEGQDVNFMDIITLKAEMVPWFFCLQTLVLERDIPLADLIGIATGHVYFYLNQKKLIPAPPVVAQWFATGLVKRRYDEIRQDFL